MCRFAAICDSIFEQSVHQQLEQCWEKSAQGRLAVGWALRGMLPILVLVMMATFHLILHHMSGCDLKPSWVRCLTPDIHLTSQPCLPFPTWFFICPLEEITDRDPFCISSRLSEELGLGQVKYSIRSALCFSPNGSNDVLDNSGRSQYLA